MASISLCPASSTALPFVFIRVHSWFDNFDFGSGHPASGYSFGPRPSDFGIGVMPAFGFYNSMTTVLISQA